MSRLRAHRADLLLLGLLMALPIFWFAPVLFPAISHRTLLPFDNLFTFEPWRSMRPELLPHNALLSDLVLENTVWKLHIRRTLADGQLPLWNPQIFTGLPFLATGQASTFYPLNLLFYVAPLAWAYGWFTAIQVGLAGVNLYFFGRILGLRPLSALCAGIIYQFSGFLIVSVVFTMFIAAVAWLPLLLAIIEFIIRKQEEKGTAGYNPTPAIAAGAGAIGLVALAGHPELIYYTLLVAALYTVTRLLTAWLRLGMSAATNARLLEKQTENLPEDAEAQNGGHPYSTKRILTLANWLLVMALLGLGLGAVQLIPLIELLPLNFRVGSASLEQVRGWAWPTRHLFTFWLPDLFGNPSHHRWFDIWNRTWVPATVNAWGEPNSTIFWGIKNYVEGGNYLSIGAWLLASIAMVRALLVAVSSRLRTEPAPAPDEATGAVPVSSLTGGHAVWFFGGLALLSLAFAFGTPLYAILFYGLPGWNQLHSPFRWVFPFTLSMAVLSGIGLQSLLALPSSTLALPPLRIGRLGITLQAPMRTLAQALAYLTLAAGLATLVVVVASLLQPQRFVDLGQRLLDSSMLAQAAFQDGRMFWSYQAANLARFGLFASLAAALVLLWVYQSGKKISGAFSRKWPDHPGVRWASEKASWKIIMPAAFTGLILLDLYIAHGCFNPAAPVKLSPLNTKPPVIDFLNDYARQKNNDSSTLGQDGAMETAPWRFTTFNLPGEKTFQANAGMYYQWHDIRGYDSIIPAQYAQLMEQIAPQANELLYNQIAPLYADQGGDVYAAMDNPLLDLLNVQYILTQHYLPNPSWREIYRDAAIGVYENREVMPRVFIVPEVQVTPAAEQPLLTADLHRQVYIEEHPGEANALLPASPQVADARISRYTANEVFVDLNLSDRGWLVFTDAYFPGWKAFIRPFGGSEGEENELTIYRANRAFRTVYVPQDGQWTVRFVYSPMSFKLGLYTSFVSFMAILLLALYWGWGKYYRPESTAGEIRTVAKNSLVPMGLSLTNKAIDFAFAMLYVRLLGPDGTGKYAFVVAIYGFFEIISRYGLGTLLTRDVAADKNQSSRYLTNVLALRTLLWLASLPLLALVTAGFGNIGQIPFLNASSIGRQEVQAIAVFALSMLFANWADAFSSMFYAFEKMEYPAGLSNVMALIKVTVGALVLLLGGGFVGLAAVSLGLNILQVIWLYHLLRGTLFRPEWRWDWPLQRWMMRTSGPLMINHLLATIFWRIDLWILRPLAGATSVGLYSVGLKYLDGLNIVPSVFTMAVFPLMSRYARQDDDNLLRAYVLSLRLLVIVSLPIAVTITALAEPLVWLVGGGEYLNVPRTFSLFGRELTVSGGSDLALRVIIWSIPIGFVNSVTQYVLIAVNQQRFLTRAFVIGVIFNITGNLLVIPSLGYVGAAIVTILSEFSLLIPFYASVRRHVGMVPWLRVCAAPLLATVLMGGAIYLLSAQQIPIWAAVIASWVIYVGILLLTGAFRGDDMATLRRALPF